LIPEQVNGFDVIAAITTHGDGRQDVVVVCDRLGAHYSDRYVTWRAFQDRETGKWVAVGGFYTSRKADAISDMIERAGFAVQLAEAA
jgi:radical SAM superfamily enzyme YgiQ (UPF0313 family)